MPSFPNAGTQAQAARRSIASQEVIDLFLEEESQHLAMLGDFIGKRISLQVEKGYHQEQYDVILMWVTGMKQTGPGLAVRAARVPHCRCQTR